MKQKKRYFNQFATLTSRDILILITEFLEHLIPAIFCLKVTRKTSQPAITCSKLTIETLEQGVKYVQS